MLGTFDQGTSRRYAKVVNVGALYGGSGGVFHDLFMRGSSSVHRGREVGWEGGGREGGRGGEEEEV